MRMPAALSCCKAGATSGQAFKREPSLHQLIALARGQIDRERPGGKDQRFFRDLPKIDITAAERAEPGVFELPRTPGIGQLPPLARKQFFDPGKDRARIDDRKSVEGDRLDCRLRGFRRHTSGHCHRPPAASVTKFRRLTNMMISSHDRARLRP